MRIWMLVMAMAAGFMALAHTAFAGQVFPLPAVEATVPAVGGHAVMIQVDAEVRCLLWVGDKPGMGPPPAVMNCWPVRAPSKIAPSSGTEIKFEAADK